MILTPLSLITTRKCRSIKKTRTIVLHSLHKNPHFLRCKRISFSSMPWMKYVLFVSVFSHLSNLSKNKSISCHGVYPTKYTIWNVTSSGWNWKYNTIWHVFHPSKFFYFFSSGSRQNGGQFFEKIWYKGIHIPFLLDNGWRLCDEYWFIAGVFPFACIAQAAGDHADGATAYPEDADPPHRYEPRGGPVDASLLSWRKIPAQYCMFID